MNDSTEDIPQSAEQEQPEEHEHGQPSIGVFLKVWLALFVLSFFSYLVDYFHLEGFLRWSLILIFMLAKAGVIMAVFMHVMWERVSLQLALILPTLVLLVLVTLMAIDSDYIQWSRLMYFSN